ncbi:MAG: hypothetical protein M1814_000714 [Vezdaea aestivalis]|nr:MAG: hypothetical protein M1814_000714 [Vezdaea aestivalis]
MRPPLRIAILECDTVLDGSFGDYVDLYGNILNSGADFLISDEISSTHGLEFSKWHVEVCDAYPVAKYPPLDDVDAVLISGSRKNAFDSDPWIEELVAWTADVLLKQDRVRVIGVCFGHQIVGRALGAKVVRNDKWELAVCKMSLTSKGKEVFKRNELHVQQMHRDILQEMPPPLGDKYPLESLGFSDVCKVQGLYYRNKLISVQGHPEFYDSLERAILDARNKLGVIGDDDYQDAISRVGNTQDGALIAAEFLRFLLDD